MKNRICELRMTAKITIKMDNAAFDDGQGGRGELARILRNVALHIEGTGATEGAVMDGNGNRVGDFKVTGRQPK